MLNTFFQVLPFALGGAVNPLGILIIFFLLSKDNPLKKAWLFLAGSTLFLLVFIFFEHFLISNVTHTAHKPTETSAIIDIALGLLLIFLAFFKKQSQQVDHHREGSNFSLFVYGFIFMIINLDTLVFYFAALKILFEAKVNLMADFVILILVILIIMSTMALPVFLATVAPEKSKNILLSLRNFTEKHGPLVSKIVIVLIALYLIYKGARFFL